MPTVIKLEGQSILISRVKEIVHNYCAVHTFPYTTLLLDCLFQLIAWQTSFWLHHTAHFKIDLITSQQSVDWFIYIHNCSCHVSRITGLKFDYCLTICKFAHHFQNRYFPKFCKLVLLWQCLQIPKLEEELVQIPSWHTELSRPLKISYLLFCLFTSNQFLVVFFSIFL